MVGAGARGGGAGKRPRGEATAQVPARTPNMTGGGGIPSRGSVGQAEERGTDSTVPSSSHTTTSPFMGTFRSHTSSATSHEAKRVSQLLSAQ